MRDANTSSSDLKMLLQHDNSVRLARRCYSSLKACKTVFTYSRYEFYKCVSEHYWMSIGYADMNSTYGETHLPEALRLLNIEDEHDSILVHS